MEVCGESVTAVLFTLNLVKSGFILLHLVIVETVEKVNPGVSMSFI